MLRSTCCVKSSVAQTHEAFKLKNDVGKLKEVTSGGPSKEAMCGSRTFEHAITIVGEQNQKKAQAPGIRRIWRIRIIRKSRNLRS